MGNVSKNTGFPLEKKLDWLQQKVGIFCWGLLRRAIERANLTKEWSKLQGTIDGHRRKKEEKG